ncbi:MAG TPA: hypothetical protein VJP02_04650, partial [Candidatus Sulfotelmatobacter sp.]|nr:hypothetical protein [Candidatus Sulfotelmatobacter sp.]
EFLTLTIQSEPRLETRKATTRAKWRSSMSAYTSVAQNVLDTADIVRDRGYFDNHRRGNVNFAFLVLPASHL